jgi:TolB protein
MKRSFELANFAAGVVLLVFVVGAIHSQIAIVRAQRKPITNGWPVVSPDGARVAFVSERDGAANVFVVPAAGGPEKQVSHTNSDVDSPSWSRDGSEIRFAVYDNRGSSTLYAATPDGARQRVIGKLPGQGVEISPDGKRAVYNVSGSWTKTKLVVSNLDGSDARQITDGSALAWNRRWSPDGKRIAFTGHDTANKTQIFLVNADGSGLRQMTHEPGVQVPAWSRDGGKLAAQVNIEKGRAELCVIDFSNGAVRRVAAHPEPYLDEVPSWFPDGGRLAFQSTRSGSTQVWVMNSDGSNAHQVTGHVDIELSGTER